MEILCATHYMYQVVFAFRGLQFQIMTADK